MRKVCRDKSICKWYMINTVTAKVMQNKCSFKTSMQTLFKWRYSDSSVRRTILLHGWPVVYSYYRLSSHACSLCLLSVVLSAGHLHPKATQWHTFIISPSPCRCLFKYVFLSACRPSSCWFVRPSIAPSPPSLHRFIHPSPSSVPGSYHHHQ